LNRRWLLWPLALLAMLAFVGLGRWQLRRADEKQAMLAGVATVLAQRDAQSLAAQSLQDSRAYAWAAGRGRFLPGPALLLDNQRRGLQVGVEVFRVFQPNGGRALLVDLGWLALDGARHLPQLPASNDEQTLRGLMLPPPSPGLALGPAYTAVDRERWLLTRIDLTALSGGLNSPLAPRVLRVDPEQPIGYARDLDILPNTLPPEKHRGYALQWFSLAAAMLILAVFLSLRRRSHD
jgi:cytochrome oxidase assembly protein ShyY1